MYGKREADQRDVPTVCLILSYASRLNGSYCYQHHHGSASCQREAHTNTAVIWHDSSHRLLQATTKKKWTKDTPSTTSCLVLMFINQMFLRRRCVCLTPYLTDVISQNPEEIRCNSICHLRVLNDRGPHVHSCPHTCYHMLVGNVLHKSNLLRFQRHSVYSPKSNIVLQCISLHSALSTTIFSHFLSIPLFLCLWRKHTFPDYKLPWTKNKVKPVRHNVHSVQDFLHTPSW